MNLAKALSPLSPDADVTAATREVADASASGAESSVPTTACALRSDVEVPRMRVGWDRVVDQNMATLWKASRERYPSAEEAADVCQLLWLRLELTIRRSGMPRSPAEWLACALASEASGRPPLGPDANPPRVVHSDPWKEEDDEA